MGIEISLHTGNKVGTGIFLHTGNKMRTGIFLYTGNKVGTGISLQYNTEAATSGQCTIVRMAAEGGFSKKSGIMWITALHKVSCSL